ALDPEANLLRKKEGDLVCDLSGIAKGYAVDRVAEAIAARGMSDTMVEVGGEVRAAGRNRAGRIWRIGIERPQLLRGSVQRVVALDGLALATSGDYRNYREHEGLRFSHIIDPRTGRPIRHRLASVSVVYPRCMMADALATGLMVMGPVEGWELALRQKLAALFLVREGDGFRERATPAFEELTPSAERQSSAAHNSN
ncbi:MAG: FAD:protein FMN transferase, partial [bacterium]|nr:FAD:protein FMN transferase [bacterium]